MVVLTAIDVLGVRLLTIRERIMLVKALSFT